jgi:hypothetical protein
MLETGATTFIRYCHAPCCLYQRVVVSPFLAPGTHPVIGVLVREDHVHLDQIILFDEVNEMLDAWAAGEDVFVGPGVVEDVGLGLDEDMARIALGE